MLGCSPAWRGLFGSLEIRQRILSIHLAHGSLRLLKSEAGKGYVQDAVIALLGHDVRIIFAMDTARGVLAKIGGTLETLALAVRANAVAAVTLAGPNAEEAGGWPGMVVAEVAGHNGVAVVLVTVMCSWMEECDDSNDTRTCSCL